METFTNVISGLKKVFKAQIFMLIGNVLFYASLIVLAVATLAVIANGLSDFVGLTENSTFAFFANNFVLLIVFFVLIIVGHVFMIIGYINNIIGVKRAGKDEDGYNTAFWCILFALIVTVITVVLQLLLPQASIVDDIAGVISSVMNVLGIIFIIQSTQVVLVKKNNEEYALKGNNAVFFIILPYVIAIIARLISVFARSNTVTLVVCIIALVCTVIGYILYLIFLKKSSKIIEAAEKEEAEEVPAE